MSFRVINVFYIPVLGFSIPLFGDDFPLTEPSTVDQLDTGVCGFSFLKIYLGYTFRMSLENENSTRKINILKLINVLIFLKLIIINSWTFSAYKLECEGF